MRLSEVLDQVRKYNVILISDGVYLKSYPAELTPDMRRILADHRDEIIKTLSSQSQVPGIVIYRLCMAVRFVHDGIEYGGCEQCKPLSIGQKDTNRPQDYHRMQYIIPSADNPSWLEWSCRIGYIRTDDAVLNRWIAESKEIE